MKNILFLLFIAAVFRICTLANAKYSRQPRLHLREIPLPPYVRPIPGGDYNYRSAQLTALQLDTLLAAGVIRQVIRLNGDGPDAAGIPIDTERVHCDAAGVRFAWFNAHSPAAADSIHTILLQGRALIHCRHGFDRTGAMVGYHLRRQGYSIPDVLRHNHWENYREKKGESYEKYLAIIQ